MNGCKGSPTVRFLWALFCFESRGRKVAHNAGGAQRWAPKDYFLGLTHCLKPHGRYVCPFRRKKVWLVKAMQSAGKCSWGIPFKGEFSAHLKEKEARLNWQRFSKRLGSRQQIEARRRRRLNKVFSSFASYHRVLHRSTGLGICCTVFLTESLGFSLNV